MNKKLIYKAVWLIAGLLLFFVVVNGCGDKITNAPSKQKLLPVEGKILFTVAPNPRVDVGFGWFPPHVLLLRTEGLYPCSNWLISSKLIEYGAGTKIPAFEILIDGVEPQELCLRAFGPAYQTFAVNLPFSMFILGFKYKNDYDNYLVSRIDDYTFTVKELNSSFTVYKTTWSLNTP